MSRKSWLAQCFSPNPSVHLILNALEPSTNPLLGPPAKLVSMQSGPSSSRRTKAAWEGGSGRGKKRNGRATENMLHSSTNYGQEPHLFRVKKGSRKKARPSLHEQNLGKPTALSQSKELSRVVAPVFKPKASAPIKQGKRRGAPPATSVVVVQVKASNPNAIKDLPPRY